LFRRWQRDGTWARILTALQAVADAAGRIVWDVSVDSTVARAHQHAAGARKRGICRLSHRVGYRPNRPIMRWVDLGVD
jgi:transposase